MTYDARETGVETAEPVELYEFVHGSTVYRYTSADEDQSYGGETYAAVTLSRSAIEATQEMARGALSIECARTLPLLDVFNPVPPGEVITMTLRRFHRGDAEAIVAWIGRVLNVGWDGLRAQIRCESVYTSMKRPGLRRMYQKQCPHVLYSTQCGVLREAQKIARAVVGRTGLAVTMADMVAFASGTFDGGYIEWIPATGLVERRAIRSQVGAVITINFQAPGLGAGVSADLFPGCNHTLGAGGCARYSNQLNYGGMPYIPSKNPFDGTPIF